jgi:hypothetical protein
MKWHKAILDIAARLVHLNSLVYGKVILHLSAISRIKVSLHHMLELKLVEIHVACEFSDVFPDDLPGMSPKRAIEFKIELHPITTPVELAKLKIQLQDLLHKGYIHPSTCPWGHAALFVSKKDKELCLCVDY